MMGEVRISPDTCRAARTYIGGSYSADGPLQLQSRKPSAGPATWVGPGQVRHRTGRPRSSRALSVHLAPPVALPVQVVPLHLDRLPSHLAPDEHARRPDGDGPDLAVLLEDMIASARCKANPLRGVPCPPLGDAVWNRKPSGLDVAKNSVVATAVDSLGRLIDQSSLGPTDQELIEYLRRLPGVKRVALEACTMWEHYHDAAVASGAEVVLSHPYKTRLIT